MDSWIKALTVATVLAASTAAAMPYFEVSDAGQNLSDAQSIGSGVDVIHGNVANGSADLFSFYWGGGAFTADTIGSVADTQLYLFNAAGQGVWANDQHGPAPWPQSIDPSWSQIVDPALSAGQYFIGISIFDYDPYSSAGAIFPSAPFNGQFGPLNMAPLDHWAPFSWHQSAQGDYVVNFNKPTSVDEPSMLVELCIGLTALGFVTRLRRGVVPRAFLELSVAKMPTRQLNSPSEKAGS